MAVIVLCSAKGSPGVSTTALALAAGWPRRVVVAECDPAGGDALAGYYRGWLGGRCALLEVLSAVRRGRLTDLDEYLLPLDQAGTKALLSGVVTPAQAACLAACWGQLAGVFAALEDFDPPVDVLADCGRLNAVNPPTDLVRRADLVVLVLRSSLVSVHAAHAEVEQLRHDLGLADGRLALLVVGEGEPYSAKEISAHLAIPVVGALPMDWRAAASFIGARPMSRRLPRSALVRAARGVGAELLAGVAARRGRLTGPGLGPSAVPGREVAGV